MTLARSAISATGLRKSFGDHVVLDGIDLDVAEGTIFALLGPNGAGKTTMVQILSTLIGADAGELRVAGNDLARDPDAVRAAVGVTGQFSAVDNLLTGQENLILMADLHHLGRAHGRRRAAEQLDRFDLTDAANRPAATYSGGMRRRLDLAMTLVGTPRLIFLDEPTAGLDPRSRHTMWQIIRQLVADGVTVFLTTQYLEEADELADRIAVLDHGRLIAEGTADERKRRVPGGHVRLQFADPSVDDDAAAAQPPPHAALPRLGRRDRRHTDRLPAAIRLRLGRHDGRRHDRRIRRPRRVPRLRHPRNRPARRGRRSPGHGNLGRHGYDRRHHQPVPHHGHRARLGADRTRRRQPDTNDGRHRDRHHRRAAPRVRAHSRPGRVDRSDRPPGDDHIRSDLARRRARDGHQERRNREQPAHAADPAAFLGSGFVPTDSIPTGMRWFAVSQPFTPIMETLRGLPTGTHIGNSRLLAITWSVAIGLVGYLWAKRLFNRDPTA